MIKRAGKEDYKRVVEFLNHEGSMNTTLLANIEKYGFEKDFQDIWLCTYNFEEPLAVIMRHFNILYIYNQGSFFAVEEIASFVIFTGPEIIMGKLDVLSDLSIYLKDMFVEPSVHMCFVDNSKLVSCSRVIKARIEDCKQMAQLVFSIPEFGRFYNSSKEIERGIRRRIEMGMSRYFIIKRDNVIISQAYTTIESSKYATIGGVITREEYRKQGLASLVVSKICEDILKDNKIPNLFYSNAEAGRIYVKLGFKIAGNYGMLLNHKYKSKNLL